MSNENIYEYFTITWYKFLFFIAYNFKLRLMQKQNKCPLICTNIFISIFFFLFPLKLSSSLPTKKKSTLLILDRWKRVMLRWKSFNVKIVDTNVFFQVLYRPPVCFFRNFFFVVVLGHHEDTRYIKRTVCIYFSSRLDALNCILLYINCTVYKNIIPVQATRWSSDRYGEKKKKRETSHVCLVFCGQL